MGTGRTVPAWATDILLMETFGWTEKQLREENSLLTIARACAYLDIRARAEKEKNRLAELKAKAKTRGGG